MRAALDQVIRQTDDRTKRKHRVIKLGQAFRKVESHCLALHHHTVQCMWNSCFLGTSCQGTDSDEEITREIVIILHSDVSEKVQSLITPVRPVSIA